jgi:hypothetical protein
MGHHDAPRYSPWGTTGPLMKSRMIEISYETHQEIPWGITGPLMKSRMIEISYETHQEISLGTTGPHGHHGASHEISLEIH